jgi:hypothetical protein
VNTRASVEFNTVSTCNEGPRDGEGGFVDVNVNIFTQQDNLYTSSTKKVSNTYGTPTPGSFAAMSFSMLLKRGSSSSSPPMNEHDKARIKSRENMRVKIRIVTFCKGTTPPVPVCRWTASLRDRPMGLVPPIKACKVY